MAKCKAVTSKPWSPLRSKLETLAFPLKEK